MGLIRRRILVLLLVGLFRSSSALAGAYGIAVSGTIPQPQDLCRVPAG